MSAPRPSAGVKRVYVRTERSGDDKRNGWCIDLVRSGLGNVEQPDQFVHPHSPRILSKAEVALFCGEVSDHTGIDLIVFTADDRLGFCWSDRLYDEWCG
jgi:hypothetical protein